ncbi:hypothetical protein OK006_2463 [Actinobacteria bacterium OK006]|nr:hypothetical protein OK006_2463 [Actinobacteria bacterium OK006]
MPEATEVAGPPEGAHTSTTGATIELENLTKRYPSSREPAVDSVNMEIKAGELVSSWARRDAASPPRSR